MAALNILCLHIERVIGIIFSDFLCKPYIKKSNVSYHIRKPYQFVLFIKRRNAVAGKR